MKFMNIIFAGSLKKSGVICTFLLVCLTLCSGSAMAHDFTFLDIQGKQQRLVDYRGKWVLVNFWATWCPPCQEETPELITLHNAHKNTDLVVIGVALDSTRPAVSEFVSKYAIPYPIIISSYTAAETEVGVVDALPTTYLYDPTGKQIIFQEGVVSRSDVETLLALKNKH
jgi:thiol-disulfide isomerase/thioredoxin